MSLWIKILCSFFLCLNAKATCNFAPHIAKVYSLSGPVTVAIKELGLLNNPKLKGISVFNPISKDEFKGRVYPGGVFMSQSVTSEFAGGVLFFDVNRELSKTFTSMSSLQAVEINSRGLTPLEVTDLVNKTLEPFLKGCEKNLLDFRNKTVELENKILRKIPHPISVLFFLGEFKGPRPPEFVIVNDGIIKWLIEKKKVITYPSPLPYVNWSAKVMQSLPKNIIKVAIKDSANTNEKDIKKGQIGETLIYPGSLVPGITQLESIDYWLTNR